MSSPLHSPYCQGKTWGKVYALGEALGVLSLEVTGDKECYSIHLQQEGLRTDLHVP